MRTPEINETRQIDSKETQTDFPEVYLSSSSISKEEILPKYIRIGTDLWELNSHFNCKLLNMMRKIESLINSASNGYLCQSCENMKGNLSFLEKELSAKSKFIKSLLETQTAILNSLSNSTSKSVSLSSPLDCSIQNGEEDMENKADKGKHKISQSEQKLEKNPSKLFMGNLNPRIKKLIL